MKNLAKLSSQIFLLFFVSLFLHGNLSAQNKANTMPKWLQEHMEYMTEGTGRWITDNSKYKSEKEPFDEYGLQWKWGIGKKSIKGRLFALKDKKEVATFWEFSLFWHPKKRQATLQQFGGTGVFGIGEMRNIKMGNITERMTEMTFYNLNGTSWKDLHKVFEKKDEHRTISFGFKDGSWAKQREYVWKREVK